MTDLPPCQAASELRRLTDAALSAVAPDGAVLRHLHLDGGKLTLIDESGAPAWSGNDLSVFNMAPQLERLFLAFFLFTADVWNAVVNHFGPGLKGLACTGNSLIGAHKAFGNAVIPHQGMQSGNIALQRAVGLYGNEAAFGTKARALSGDYAAGRLP